MLLWPSVEQEAQWRAEARAHHPDPASWEEFYVGCRWAQEIDRRQAELDRRLKRATEDEVAMLEQQQIAPPECPPGLWAINYAMVALGHFLFKQGLANGHPISRLIVAIGHLAGGGSHVPAFLRPRDRGRGSPGKGDGVDFVKAIAARAYNELVNANFGDKAGALVAAALRSASERGLGSVTAETVRNWRDRAEQGPGPGASDVMVQHYREPLDPCLGATPQERGKALLRALEASAASLVG
jgi:hypothetical protein